MSATADWFACHDNLLMLAHHLIQRDEFSRPGDLLYFFEKPWKWQAEWEAMSGTGPHGYCRDCEETTTETDDEGKFMCASCKELEVLS